MLTQEGRKKLIALTATSCVVLCVTWLFNNEEQLFTKVTECSKNSPQHTMYLSWCGLAFLI